ncbi:MAG: hypothetical protein ACI9H6_000275 [Patiriisocius sp.]|jgi:hypothetical protein
MFIFFQTRVRKKNTAGMRTSIYQGGFTFVELIVTAALVTIVFGGLFGGFQVLIQLVGKSKAEAGATALLSEKMEYIRSLPYNDIGTVSGVPSGTITQNGTTTLNDIAYTERILIQYIDDPADGFGGADTNAILSDYKQVKIEYTWSIRGDVTSASLVSNVIPPGIETTAGGGTIRVNVFDATVTPLSGASVRFVNNSGTSTIDTIRFTDPSGVAYLSGAPAAANYEITVTDTGYSTDRTHVSTTSNPNPSTQPIAVLESQVSTVSFQIDELSDLLFTTVGVASYDSFFDTFADTSLVDTLASTTVTGGAVELTDSLGVYDVAGTVHSASTTPGTLDSWYTLGFSASTSASTSVAVSLMYDNAGTMELVPDADFAGNSIGFTISPIDITSLDSASYDSLGLQATFQTTDTAYTPQLHSWELTHVQSRPLISGIQLGLEGSKSIGTDALSQPVLKHSTTGTTDSNGEWTQDDIEWDIYDIAVLTGGYDVLEVCGSTPYSLNPGVSEEVMITLDAASANSLRVLVTDTSSAPISGATVRLENTGVDVSSATSLCGQTFFNTGLFSADDYTMTVSASGYTTEIVASTTVGSNASTTVILN